ncbi:uncharacterized protein [Epargyreus clarus]|uniref:uncharacterized protein n=1 Tax=Epargyreus clarus TaxID=520877 RepID=UPI003C2E2396
MPLRRTPPASPQVRITQEPMSVLSAPNFALSQTLHHCASEPDLNKPGTAAELDCGALNVTQRAKRKRSVCTDTQLNDFMLEMKSMFEEFKAHQRSQDAKMEKISASIDEIKTQNVAMQNTADFLANKFECIQSQIEKLESDRCKDLQHIRELEEKLESLERHKRASCIEIKNIPCVAGETKEVLLKHVSSIAQALNTQVDQNNIRDVFRITKKDSEDKTIIVDFTSVLIKEVIIRKYKDYNKINKTSKFSTETLRIKGTRKPVFISENLTPKMKRLLYLSKEYAKTNAYDHCWVSHGKIFLRKKEGSKAIPIRSDQDLVNLKSTCNL